MAVAADPTHPESSGQAGRLSYDVVDVFTDRAFAGNALAVVYDADSLSSEQMQAIATEFNLSETSFPLALTQADVAEDADYRVRIFTPGGEVPFAGHPTLGTAWALARRGLLRPGRRLQSCRAGMIGVEVPEEVDAAVELSAHPRDAAHELSPDETAAVARLVGLPAADAVGPVRVAGCGLSWLYLPVAAHSLASVRSTGGRVSEAALDTSFLRDPLEGVCVYAVEPRPGGRAAGSTLVVRARVFVPGLGVTEDPATGSAAAGLGIVLVASGHAAADGQTAYRITQGVEMGRPSLLWGRVEASHAQATRCHVAGRVVATATGTIVAP